MKYIAIAIFLNLIRFTSTQVCGEPSPINFNDCNKFSDTKNTCCYGKISLYNETVFEREEAICIYIPINQTFVAKYLDELDIGLPSTTLFFKLDCGEVINNTQFGTCGPNDDYKPLAFVDCHKYSTNSTNCCFFQSPNKKTSCLNNPNKNHGTMDLFGYILQCSENYIFVKILNLLFVFFIILIN